MTAGRRTTTASDIIEAILDPLMFSDLAERVASIAFTRLAPESVLIDLGPSQPQFVLTVAERPGPKGAISASE
jgi:hypothetical protein